MRSHPSCPRRGLRFAIRNITYVSHSATSNTVSTETLLFFPHLTYRTSVRYNLPMLTERQQSILDFINEYVEGNGFPPSVREIGRHFGIYPATVQDHISALERKGVSAKEAISIADPFRSSVFAPAPLMAWHSNRRKGCGGHAPAGAGKHRRHDSPP